MSGRPCIDREGYCTWNCPTGACRTAASGADREPCGCSLSLRQRGMHKHACRVASGADQPTLRGPFRGSPPFEHSAQCTAPDPETCRKRGCEVQPTLRDQLAGLDVLRLMHASLPHDPRAGDPAFCAEDGKPWPCPTYEALPLIEADRERAKAEGAAEALEKAALHSPTPLNYPAHLLRSAAALRGTT